MTVRVRFAPSPTGFLHIGNARAALINWLFAKKHQGVFLLRLDDTDLERSEDRFTKAIYEDMAWLGLTHQETFKQSDRFDRYHEAKQQLIDAGRLYPCYETPEELDFKRKRSLAKGQPPIYDRAALNLTAADIQKFEAEGRKPHWRFKLNPGVIQWDDMVRGHVEFHGESLSDPVLIRADGAFLYTLTSVVDDLDTKITHIIRGEDHVTNTATQIQLFEAVNNNIPFPVTFGHTTLLMDKNGQALSKRLGSLSLGQMRDQGIEAMAINSLLARLGTSLPVEPTLSLDALAKSFDMSTFSRAAPRFCDDELRTLNHKLFHLMPFAMIKERLTAINATSITEPLWDLIKNNITFLSDVLAWQNILCDDNFKGTNGADTSFYQIALQCLPKAPWTLETWAQWTNDVKTETGRKGKELFMPLRNAITGHDHGPEMKELILHLGYDRVYKRIEKVINA